MSSIRASMYCTASSLVTLRKTVRKASQYAGPFCTYRTGVEQRCCSASMWVPAVEEVQGLGAQAFDLAPRHTTVQQTFRCCCSACAYIPALQMHQGEREAHCRRGGRSKHTTSSLTSSRSSSCVSLLRLSYFLISCRSLSDIRRAVV